MGTLKKPRIAASDSPNKEEREMARQKTRRQRYLLRAAVIVIAYCVLAVFLAGWCVYVRMYGLGAL